MKTIVRRYKKETGQSAYIKNIFGTPIPTISYVLWLEEQCTIANVVGRSEQLCGFFEADNKNSSATKCKCGREKWEHPKAT
jgi:hypothetical protein